METPFDKQILQGLATCRWSGRNEIVDANTAMYYLDGAQ
jgi:folylpolyglutamate synthase/dihydropteroate synthase